MKLKDNGFSPMHTLLSRFKSTPLLTFEVLTASFFISLLNLALPIFVIQLLNRYVSHGFEGTLYTLTSGVCIAILLQFGFRIVRTALLSKMNEEPDRMLAQKVLHNISTIRFGVISTVPREQVAEIMTDIQKVQTGREPANIIPLIDIPFTLLYLAALTFLSPTLAFIALIGTMICLSTGAYSSINNNKLAKNFTRMFTTYRIHELKALNAPETIRAFNGADYLARFRQDKLSILSSLRQRLGFKQEQGQSLMSSIGGLQSVLIYSVGAILVVQGELNVGILIGANILASRAFQSVAQLFRSIHLFRQAEQSRKTLEQLSELPKEKEKGIAVRQYTGRLRFHDITFAYTGASGPLFESLSLTLEPGQILTVSGSNGSGKTTLIRMLTGLLDCSRGDILVDEINLRQIAMHWWRKQIMYLPQEPDFLMASIRDNITLAGQLDDAPLNQVIQAAGLREFLDKTTGGADTVITEPARIPPGIRKRIALARALATNGQLVLFDEPTEALDQKGCDTVYNLLNKLAQVGKTMIICSNDPHLIKAGHVHLDLNHKPVPLITRKHDNE